jgi:hypothetical protein
MGNTSTLTPASKDGRETDIVRQAGRQALADGRAHVRKGHHLFSFLP